jgi:hypothetical protein
MGANRDSSQGEGNSLKSYLNENHISVLSAMNALQAAGIVSDHAVWPGEVADADARLAIQWLREHNGELT